MPALELTASGCLLMTALRCRYMSCYSVLPLQVFDSKDSRPLAEWAAFASTLARHAAQLLTERKMQLDDPIWKATMDSVLLRAVDIDSQVEGCRAVPCALRMSQTQPLGVGALRFTWQFSTGPVLAREHALQVHSRQGTARDCILLRLPASTVRWVPQGWACAPAGVLLSCSAHHTGDEFLQMASLLAGAAGDWVPGGKTADHMPAGSVSRPHQN